MRAKDENKRIAIYNAAMEIINRDGLAAASMSKIARAAGVSSSTLYVYFDNKEDMLNKLFLMAKQESSAATLKGLSVGMDIKTGVETYLRSLFVYMRDNPIRFSFHEQFYNSPKLSPGIREEGFKHYAPVYEQFELAVNEGVVKNYPARLVEAFVVAPIMSLAHAHHKGELDVNEEILKKAIDMVWNAIKA
jgi:AcrR family transcriptional regulator